MLELDGAHGEGGGQILRTALFLSLLLSKPFRIVRIRRGRAKPGLKAQHATILRLLADMTGSTAEPLEVGATEVTFRPGSHRAGSWRADIGTAGCIPLLLQTVLPVAIATPGRTRLELVGGTHVPFGPTADWLRMAYLPYVAPLARIDLQTERVGFAPEGGGRVVVEVEQDASDAAEPDGLRRLVRERLGARRLAQGAVTKVTVASIAARSLGRGIARRQAMAALAHLLGTGPPPEVVTEEVESDGPGSALTCAIEDATGNRLASDRLGGRNVAAERVGEIAARSLMEDWRTGATVDRHMADHVVPWVALGAGAVRTPHPTPHLETNAWLCNQFLGDWTVRTDRNLVR
ncbi:MAG: RNA 3'-terminal phosphate cyclase [Thermoplasmatota archaeon]